MPHFILAVNCVLQVCLLNSERKFYYCFLITKKDISRGSNQHLGMENICKVISLVCLFVCFNGIPLPVFLQQCKLLCQCQLGCTM